MMVVRVVWGIFDVSKALFFGFVKNGGFAYIGTNKITLVKEGTRC